MNVAQPDFTLAALPTNLRLPKGKFAFRVTHRFARPLGEGDFGSLLEDFFGFDSGAQIGLELRYGLFRGAQVGINRTSDRTIQFFGQYDVKSQQSFPIGIGVWAQRRRHQQLPRQLLPRPRRDPVARAGEHGAVYAEPIWVNNTNAEPAELVDDNSTLMLGLGTRLRVRPTVYVTAEVSPRLTGYAPGDALVSFGLEKRAGGHAFSINFSNGFGTTMAQVARGGHLVRRLVHRLQHRPQVLLTRHFTGVSTPSRSNVAAMAPHDITPPCGLTTKRADE